MNRAYLFQTNNFPDILLSANRWIKKKKTGSAMSQPLSCKNVAYVAKTWLSVRNHEELGSFCVNFKKGYRMKRTIQVKRKKVGSERHCAAVFTSERWCFSKIAFHHARPLSGKIAI